jgi:hypothetical protein
VVLGSLGASATTDHSPLPVHLAVLVLLGATGLALGALDLLLTRAAVDLARLIPARLSRPAAWAVSTTVLLSPLLALLATAAFSGRHARTLPARPAWIAGLALAMIAVLLFALRWLLARAPRWLPAIRSGQSRAIGLATLPGILLGLSLVWVSCRKRARRARTASGPRTTGPGRHRPGAGRPRSRPTDRTSAESQRTTQGP